MGQRCLVNKQQQLGASAGVKEVTEQKPCNEKYSLLEFEESDCAASEAQRPQRVVKISADLWLVLNCYIIFCKSLSLHMKCQSIQQHKYIKELSQRQTK